MIVGTAAVMATVAGRTDENGGYTPSAGPMVVFQDSCISDSNNPQEWEPSDRTT